MDFGGFLSGGMSTPQCGSSKVRTPSASGKTLWRCCSEVGRLSDWMNWTREVSGILIDFSAFSVLESSFNMKHIKK